MEDIGYLVRSYFSGRPFLVERDDLEDMRILVGDLVKNQAVDVIHADQLTMSQFALLNHEDRKMNGVGSNHGMKQGVLPFRIFDAHNAVWTILDRMSENVAWYLQPFARFEARKIKQFEGKIIKVFDHTLAVTDIDKSALISAADSKNNGSTPVEQSISVVPIAVDTSQIQPIKLQPGSNTILTLGTLHYPPNADGIRWFFEQVYPIVREANPHTNLTIIGKNPPPDFIRFAEQNHDHVTVTGYVPDLEPYFKKAAVLVIPVRAGGGMRVRILEGLAYGEAIVTTTIGLEGIEAESGKEVIVADTPQDFAEAVLQLLDNFEMRAEIAKNGRDLVEWKYDWQVVLRKVNDIYLEFERNYQGISSNAE
jgi:glycosyltransferase involved in cell wall biosynthesis